MGCSLSSSYPYLCNYYLLLNVSLWFGFIFAETNNYSLVFTRCPNQTSSAASPPLLPSPLLSSLFQELVDKSSETSFFHTYVGDDTTAISGRFQCRRDISNRDCHACVNQLPGFSAAFCGQTVPARVQLSGCYLHYEAEELMGADQTSAPFQLLHSACSQKRADERSRQLRYQVLAELERCVMNGEIENREELERGFCKLRYESMHGVAQCAGNLGHCECGECVNMAAQMALDECGYSASGEIYMDRCFVSYKYDHGSGSSNGRLVAIAVGGIVASVIVGAILASRGKKYDDW
ncbi:PREDICTED: cysteine-rich repeat secretory protein 3-like [Ipomoea nil]|uniref:cysteine-rich repeat secretory protein 3-like n=1 Tax=Ipomoea nil TaxID=35883 RepID=UPI000900CCB0|nr:PREDICTED: cysteine-rich repeat secretory protein 3-like [Ipomoea nil]